MIRISELRKAIIVLLASSALLAQSDDFSVKSQIHSGVPDVRQIVESSSEVRSGTQDRSVRADRLRNGCGSGKGKRHHRNDVPHPSVAALRRSKSSGSSIAFPRAAWARLSRRTLRIDVYFR
jgi:hypothetical protein